MPLNRQGALSAQVNTDILAFLLQANNFPSGTEELGLSDDLLRGIRFDVSRPSLPVAGKPKTGR
jgi:hypothetical protein